MSIEQSQRGIASGAASAISGSLGRPTVEALQRELARCSATEARLREGLACQENLLSLKDTLIRQQEILIRESEHRLLNGLQMVMGLLRLQARSSANSDIASQLLVASNRVGAIERIHRRLRYPDGAQTVAFKPYLEELCQDLCSMLSSDTVPDRVITVEAVEVDLPVLVGSPLGFIVNELLTNAVKYGEGAIAVCLRVAPGKGYALSVSNKSQAFPEGFDSATSKGLGMRLVRSFVERIGGQLHIGRSDDGRGTRITVLFPG